MKPPWTRPTDIRETVLRRWRRGEILAAGLAEACLFPMEVRLNRPSPGEIAERFGDVQDWVRELAGSERETRGFGYALRWESTRNRVQGSNEIPVAVEIPTEADALKLIGTVKEAERFRELAARSLARHPALRGWITRRPMHVLKNSVDWDRVLAVLDAFVRRPRPDVYPRQLEIPGVDSKFIEQHRKLLGELLDEVLPPSAVDASATGVRGFNRRYGLRDEPPLVRFRLLDAALTIDGLTDISLPPAQFAALSIPVRRVFITENRTNGLAFPDSAGSMVVFGLGYGLERLSEATWIRDADVRYWGDIDTHGFGILNRLRASLPDARSFLMDRETLLAHRDLWGQEPEANRYTGDASRLTSEERTLLSDLQADILGERVRLEQERVGFGRVKSAIAGLG